MKAFVPDDLPEDREIVTSVYKEDKMILTFHQMYLGSLSSRKGEWVIIDFISGWGEDWNLNLKVK